MSRYFQRAHRQVGQASLSHPTGPVRQAEPKAKDASARAIIDDRQYRRLSHCLARRTTCAPWRSTFRRRCRASAVQLVSNGPCRRTCGRGPHRCIGRAPASQGLPCRRRSVPHGEDRRPTAARAQAQSFCRTVTMVSPPPGTSTRLRRPSRRRWRCFSLLVS